MDSERFARLKKLFDGVADLSSSELEAYLAQNHMGDDTRRSLRELLEADAALVGSTVRRATPPLSLSSANDMDAWVGRRVGAFVIERELGRGGMGSVFLAHRVDESVTQKVALKLVRQERIDVHTLARFRLERQVLAVLKHPNIATLIDAGELEDGTPFVAMEYVEGQPIIEYVQSHKLGLKARLQLFLSLCDAVSYAHRNMVVHRDIKSSNILVTEEGQPKLLDFGIAKPLIAQLGIHEIHETSAAQRFFSPYNASPEQLRGGPITVACDVYGLGTLLYELLADLPPFDFAQMSVTDIERTILDVDVAAPSERVNDARSARALSGDLDAIVLRALRKHPEARYESVAALAADIRAHQEGRPVEARHGTYLYRLSRFVSRHRTALASAVLVITVVAVGGWATARQYVSTLRERDRADSVTSIIIDALSSIDPERAQGKELTAREVFEQVKVVALNKKNLDPVARTKLIRTIAKIYLQLSDMPEALSLLDQLGADAVFSDRAEKSEYLNERAGAAIAADQLARAETYIKAGIGDASKEEMPAWRVLRAKLDFAKSDNVSARTELESLLADAQALDVETLSSARGILAQVMFAQGLREEPYAQAEQVLKEDRQRFSDTDPRLLRSLEDLLYMAIDMHKEDVAKSLANEDFALVKRLYGEQSVAYSNTLSTQAAVASMDGQLQKSVEWRKQALDIAIKVQGEDHQGTAGAVFNLANALDDAGDVAEALKYYVRANDMAQRLMPPSSLRPFLFRALLAYSQTRNKQYEDSDKSVAECNAVVAKYPKLGEFDITLVIRLTSAANALGRAPTEANRKNFEEQLRLGRAAAEGDSTRQTIEALAKLQPVLMGLKPSA